MSHKRLNAPKAKPGACVAAKMVRMGMTAFVLASWGILMNVNKARTFYFLPGAMAFVLLVSMYLSADAIYNGAQQPVIMLAFLYMSATFRERDDCRHLLAIGSTKDCSFDPMSGWGAFITWGGVAVGVYTIINAALIAWTYKDKYQTLAQRRHASPFPTTRAVVFWVCYLVCLAGSLTGMIIGSIFDGQTDYRTNDQRGMRNFTYVVAGGLAFVIMIDAFSTYRHFSGKAVHAAVCGHKAHEHEGQKVTA